MWGDAVTAQSLAAEWKFECEQGLVCGVGSPPPLHTWSFAISPQLVRIASASNLGDVWGFGGRAVADAARPK